MKLGIRGKLLAASLGVMLAALLAAEAFLRPAIEADLLDRMRADLFVRLALIERAVTRAADFDPARLHALVEDVARRANGRITIIDARGAVIADSEVSPRDLASLENHRERPEVAAALDGGARASTRYSVTVHRRLMYAAVPLALAEGARGVVRVAVALEDVDAAMGHLRHMLWVALGIGFAVAVLLSTAGAHVVTRAFRRMTEAARQMAGGNLDVRVRVRVQPGGDEIADLGRALDAMAAGLASTLAALRKERDLLGLILSSMQEGVLVLDEAGRTLLANPALRATLELPAAPEGRAALELVRNADLKTMVDHVRAERAAVTGEIETPGPKPRRLLVHAAPLPNGILAVFVDVTEIRRLETLRKDFVANVSHELRTPITAVRSAVETLRLTLEQDRAMSRRFVDIIERNAQRLGALVEDLLDLSRIESKEYRPAADAVSVRAAAEQVLDMLRARMDAKQLVVHDEVAPELPPARADRTGVEQVLTNLLDNAVKYCGAGADVRVRARQTGDKLRVEVVDTGPGIEPRHLPRIFERFYRVDSGRSREMGGTGLGLSIVKHLVEAMGGAVGVDSVPGKGSTFWFTLPVAGATR